MNREIGLEERARTFASLLDNVAITASGNPPEFRRARRLAAEARSWFGSRADWALVSTRDFVRLIKTPAGGRAGIPFRGLQTPLDYELLTWILWFGERHGEPQFLLSSLLAEVQAQANSVSGPGHVDWDVRAHRASLSRAMASLEDLRLLLHYPDSDIREWVETTTGNVLYEFTSLQPYLQVNYVSAGDCSPAETSVSAEQRLYRGLLLAPALYPEDDPGAFALLRDTELRLRVADDLAETFGWELDVTRSYASLVRSEVTRPARLFPSESSINHVVLLLCGVVRDGLATGDIVVSMDDRVVLSSTRIEELVRHVRLQHGANWSARLADRSLAGIVDETLGAMRGWGMIEGPDADDSYTILPLAARFRGIYSADGNGLDKGEDE